MGNRQWIDKIYATLVNRVPGIRQRYQRMRCGKGKRGQAWIYLLYLNVAYHVFRYRKPGLSEKYPFCEKKILYADGSESSLSKRKPPEVFAKELASYDVISFDVFDTLVFRPFSEPPDLFFLLGEELGYPDFKRIRMEMEWRAREKKYKKEKTYEVTLEEIYTLLEKETGIEKNAAMNLEAELEETYCFANPYMLRVAEELRHMGKDMVVTSDMYLGAENIRRILKRCGYGGFSAYYVSCETGRSKSSGDLYDEVRKKEEERLSRKIRACKETQNHISFAHVGDNMVSDVENAEKHGFSAFYYTNVNAAGAQYRPEDMSAITGGLYRGLVNTQLHNGLYIFSKEYEYGFIYGGLFVTGYCRFIHELAERYQFDRLLFLSRDGYVLKKAYELLYPEDRDRCSYIYWSRLAAAKLTAGRFKYDYFRRFLYHKVNQGYTLQQILGAMELDDMLEEICGETDLQGKTELTDKNAEKVKESLMEHWDEVLAHYEEESKAGEQYFRERLKGCKRAAAVDIGWAGSGAVTLEYLISKKWNMNVEVTGIIAGTNTCHNAEPDASETFLQSGRLISYLYSQRENRDLWKLHDPGKGHNLYWELFLDAPHGSLKGFCQDNGKWRCLFKEETRDKERMAEIQKGILEFVKSYKNVMEKERRGGFWKISGRDAYAPMLLAEGEENAGFRKAVAGLTDEMNVG